MLITPEMMNKKTMRPRYPPMALAAAPRAFLSCTDMTGSCTWSCDIQETGCGPAGFPAGPPFSASKLEVVLGQVVVTVDRDTEVWCRIPGDVALDHREVAILARFMDEEQLSDPCKGSGDQRETTVASPGTIAVDM